MSIQAKLTTKLEEFSIDDAVVEVSNQLDRSELNELIKCFLDKLGKYDEKLLGSRGFDFLVEGLLLRTNVEEHLKLYSDEITTNEKLVEIEYILSPEAPSCFGDIRQDDWVSCVDANGSYIISGSYDNSITIYSADSGKSLVTIKDAHTKPVARVKLVDRNLKGGKKLITDDICSFVSCGHDEVSILREFNTKTLNVEKVCVFNGHSRSVNCIDIIDDLVATGSFDKTIKLWSLSKEGQEKGTDDDEGDVVRKKRIRKGDASENSVTNTPNRSAVITLTGHHESVTGLRWLRGGNEVNTMASCSMDRSICIWDVEVGECKHRLHSAKPILGIDYCAERNLIISASCDRFIRLWDARVSDNSSPKTAYTSHSAWVSSVAFKRTTSNHFISGGYDNVVKLWDIRSPKACLYDLIGHHDKVLDVNWSNSSFVLSGSADCTLKIFATKD